MLQLLVTANVPSSPIPVTLTMQAIRSFETSVLTRATWHNIPEYGSLHSHRHKNLKSYKWEFHYIQNDIASISSLKAIHIQKLGREGMEKVEGEE
jgi:hypothetical protein